MAWQQVRDHDGEKREGEADANPEPSRHVVKLRIRFLDGDGHRLQGHATNGAISWLIAHDLRMHWARVLSVGDWRAACFWLQSHSALRAAAVCGLVNVRMHWDR